MIVTANSTHIPLQGAPFKLVGSYQSGLPDGQFQVFSTSHVTQGKPGPESLDQPVGTLTFDQGRLVAGHLTYFSFEEGVIIEESLADQLLTISTPEPETLTTDSYGRLDTHRKIDDGLFQESYRAGLALSHAALNEPIDLTITDQGYFQVEPGLVSAVDLMEHTLLGHFDVTYELGTPTCLGNRDGTHYNQHCVVVTTSPLEDYMVSYIPSATGLGFFIINSPASQVSPEEEEALLIEEAGRDQEEDFSWQAGDIILDGVLIAKLEPDQLSVRLTPEAYQLTLPPGRRGVSFLIPDLTVALYRQLEANSLERNLFLMNHE